MLHMFANRWKSALQRIATFDVPDRLAKYIPTIPAQIIFAIICTSAAIAIRTFIDLVSTGAGPFAVTVPAALVATLFGRLLCGIMTQILALTYMWYYALPVTGSFLISDPGDAPRIVVNLLAGILVVGLGEVFRQAVRIAIEQREMFLEEMDHRVKNNFSSIAAVLRLQMARSENPKVLEAIESAIGRVESYAKAHQFLYRDFDGSGMLQMREYLSNLCRSLSDTMSTETQIEFECKVEKANLPRDRAIAVGLLVNEIATNSVKHAFKGRKTGNILVSFSNLEDGYRLIISDDGQGMSGPARPGSLGLRLVEGLAVQAKAEMELNTNAEGTCYSFELAH